MRAFQRCFAASKVPIVYSAGFHPHMKMSFGSPPRTGWESFEEYMDIEVSSAVPELVDGCNRLLPDGLRVVACASIIEGVPKLSKDICAARMRVTVDAGGRAPDESDDMRQRLLAQFSMDTAGPDQPAMVDVTVERENGVVTVEYVSTMHGGKIVAPAEVVAASIADPDTLATPVKVTRQAQYVSRDGEYVSPLTRKKIKD